MKRRVARYFAYHHDAHHTAPTSTPDDVDSDDEEAYCSENEEDATQDGEGERGMVIAIHLVFAMWLGWVEWKTGRRARLAVCSLYYI